MGYDLNVCDASGRALLQHDELDMTEQHDTVKLAQQLGLPLLSSLPEYWGDVREFSQAELSRLLAEVERVRTIDSATADVLSAVAKVRRLAQFAIDNGGVLGVCPD